MTSDFRDQLPRWNHRFHLGSDNASVLIHLILNDLQMTSTSSLHHISGRRAIQLRDNLIHNWAVEFSMFHHSRDAKNGIMSSKSAEKSGLRPSFAEKAQAMNGDKDSSIDRLKIQR